MNLFIADRDSWVRPFADLAYETSQCRIPLAATLSYSWTINSGPRFHKKLEDLYALGDVTVNIPFSEYFQ